MRGPAFHWSDNYSIIEHALKYFDVVSKLFTEEVLQDFEMDRVAT
jgi:hypothetical protein